MYKLLVIFIIISGVYRSFIPKKTTSTKYCLTQWISKLPLFHFQREMPMAKDI